MENIKLNDILDRRESETMIKNILNTFDENKNNLLFKKGIYIYGNPGSGKTSFITNILKDLDYDIIHYDTGDIRNKAIIDNITKHNMSDKNIMSLLNKKIKKIAIIMDEIDGMNNGDKGGINTLIKLIRPKKTKKQKTEEITMNPIICIGNYHVDKKIKELMKVCNTIELKTPSNIQISNIIQSLFPDICKEMKEKIWAFVQGDLRKLSNILNIYKNNKDLLLQYINTDLFQMKMYNDDTKKIVQKLLLNPYKFEDHNFIMNETDRTIVGLLWHENIIDVLNKMDKTFSVPFYIKQLDNICFADYMDRITFQKQIWRFNEMSSLIKTFKNNKLYHSYCKNMENNDKPKNNSHDIRFTKVLTKYSTEYNNYIFIQKICLQLGMDKKDLFSFFIYLKNTYDENEIIHLFENYEMNKLEISRIYRYLEKYTKENTKTYQEEIVEEEIDLEIDYENDL